MPKCAQPGSLSGSPTTVLLLWLTARLALGFWDTADTLIKNASVSSGGLPLCVATMFLRIDFHVWCEICILFPSITCFVFMGMKCPNAIYWIHLFTNSPKCQFCNKSSFYLCAHLFLGYYVLLVNLFMIMLTWNYLNNLIINQFLYPANIHALLLYILGLCWSHSEVLLFHLRFW